jgi:hypothetical protein
MGVINIIFFWQRKYFFITVATLVKVAVSARSASAYCISENIALERPQ